MKSNVCLIIIFNHRYDKNIEILEEIYKERFHRIYYVVPFYDGIREDVIPVYESSYQFSGYVAQARRFIKEHFNHYLFIADDLLLNPQITDNNYCEWFHIGKEDAFVPHAADLGLIRDWEFESRFLNAFNVFSTYSGVNWESEIMSAESASQVMREKGHTHFFVDIRFLKKEKFKKKIAIFGRYPKLLLRLLREKRLPLPYPILGGYSDIFIVPGRYINVFSHYCGVFAAIGLFVEMAIPTALTLTCDRVVTLAQIDKTMKILWSDNEKKEVEEDNSRNINKLFNNFDTNCLCCHPVKLSRWTTGE